MILQTSKAPPAEPGNAPNKGGTEWRCTQCNKFLGELFRRKVHLRPQGGHTYFAGYPVTATCSRCGCTNSVRNDRKS